LKEYAHLLKNLSIERIRQEFDKILIGKNNVEALDELKTLGVIKIFFPEVDVLESVPGNKWHLE
jgi:tRNA nucleotidyltransferase (CCA-adding enzyme)